MKDKKILAMIAMQNGVEALISAGYSLSALISAGYSLSALRSAGYSLSDLISAGYSASALRSAGYSASALRSAGYSASDLIINGIDFPEWDSIIPLVRPYTRIWEDIQSGKRKFNQGDFGPNEPIKEEHVCKTAMCTAGNLCQLSGRYDLVKKYGHSVTASLIHQRSCPELPEQNYGTIPDEWALAYLEEMAEREKVK